MDGMNDIGAITDRAKKTNARGFSMKTSNRKQISSRTVTATVLKAVLAFSFAGLLMGSEGCEEPAARTLRRRVHMGKIEAPSIVLPQGQGTFDFEYVANAQMYDVLRRTESFSTSTIDPLKSYSPDGLSDSEASQFNQCMDPEDAEFSASGLSLKSVISERAACLIDLPQGVVSGNILDFRLTSAVGASLSLSQVAFLPGLSFDFKRYELSMALNVMDPMITNHNIAATSQQSYGSETGVNAQLSFGGFNLGPKFYYNSPLRQVVEEGMIQSLTDLKRQWDASHPWYAMVLRNCDKSIYINAGNKTDAGLMVGDVVKIQNVKYRWQDAVCSSRLLGTTVNSEPVAYAKITSVGDTMSIATVIDDDAQNYPYSLEQVIKPGARVYMHKLYTPPPTQTPKTAAQKKAALAKR